jgi:RimJ/RimL family protein N-acetyltransferase
VPSTRHAVLAPGCFAAVAQPTVGDRSLTLRPWREEDVPVLVTAYGDPAIVRWHCRTLDAAEAAEWIAMRSAAWGREEGGDWAVLLGENVAGRVSMRRLDLAEGRAELGYWVLPERRGTGIAASAVGLLAGWLFGVGMHRLELVHSVQNAASCAVARRARFQLEGTLREGLLHADGWHDAHVHARLSGDR